MTWQSALYDISKSLHAQQLDPHRTLQMILSKTGQALEVDYGCLMTFKPSKDIDKIYLLGVEDTPVIRNRVTWQTLLKKGLIGHVYHSHRLIVVRNIHADPRYPTHNMGDILPREGSAAAVPITILDHVVCVMMFIHPEIDYFTDARTDLLTEVADLASHAIANMRQVTANTTTPDTRYNAIFEHTPIPIVLTNAKGTIIDANLKASEFLGFSRGVLRGIPLKDIHVVSSSFINETLKADEKYLTTTTYDIDGNATPTLIRARKVDLDGQEALEWVLQDMSVQQELDNLRQDLTAMVYHDLRGPLSSINLAWHKLVELLQEHDNAAVLKILQLGLRGTQQVSRLVDTLLDVQRLEQGNSILNRRESAIHAVLTDALQLILPMANENGISVDLDIVKSPKVEIDPDMITRVAINLMQNAIKYTPDGGSMTVRAERLDNDLRVSVSDTGPGIPEDMRRHIFDKYSRVKYQNAPNGVGLGLAFCRLAIEAHGGQIWVESDGKNGSDFIFTLPMFAPPVDGSSDATGDDADDTQPFVVSA